MNSKHADFRVTRNGGMVFVCADMLGARWQASFCRCRKSRTAPVMIRALLNPARIFAAALVVMHIGATAIGGL